MYVIFFIFIPRGIYGVALICWGIIVVFGISVCKEICKRANVGTKCNSNNT